MINPELPTEQLLIIKTNCSELTCIARYAVGEAKKSRKEFTDHVVNWSDFKALSAEFCIDINGRMTYNIYFAEGSRLGSDLSGFIRGLLDIRAKGITYELICEW